MHGGACLRYIEANVASQRVMCTLEKRITPMIERGQADELNVDAETMKMRSSTSALFENSDATAMQHDDHQQSQLPFLPSNDTDCPLSPMPSVPTGHSSRAILHGVFGDTFLLLLRVHRQELY